MTVLRCPGCGGEMSLDVLVAHNELRQATVDLVEKGLSLGSLVLRYVGLFRPTTNRMSPDRFTKLVLQLAPDLERGAITFKGREWAVSKAMWQQGFETMLEKAAGSKLVLPLENHNYLYQVLLAQSDKAEAAEEQAREEERRHGPRAAAPQASSVPPQLAAPNAKGMPAEIRQKLQQQRTEFVTGNSATE